MNESNHVEQSHEGHIEGEILVMDRSRKAPPGWKRVLGAGVVVAVLLVFAGIVPRAHAKAELEGEAKTTAGLVPKVDVAVAAK